MHARWQSLHMRMHSSISVDNSWPFTSGMIECSAECALRGGAPVVDEFPLAYPEMCNRSAADGERRYMVGDCSAATMADHGLFVCPRRGSFCRGFRLPREMVR